jgi:dihydroxyacid dehydratase/phosphogluconate dehydratase
LSGERKDQALNLKDLRPSKIVTKKSFENAIMVHAAIAGSTNAMLRLDAMIITGQTLGENIAELEKEGFFKNRYGELKVYSLSKEEIIRPVTNPIQKEGAIAVFK